MGHSKLKGKTYEEIYGPDRALEMRQKRSESIKKYWKTADNDRKEQNRKTFIDNVKDITIQKWVRDKAIITRRKREKWVEYTDESYKSLIKLNKNKIISNDTRKKMSESAILRGYNLPEGFTHSNETKQKLSEIAKQQWKDGIHVRDFQSKGQLELIRSLRENGYNVEEEFLIDGRPFDIKINNVLIEFNGTYWHLDSRIYESDYYDKCRKCPASTIWKSDKVKSKIAKRHNYNLIIVWQYDWEDNPTTVLNKVIKFIKKHEREI